jgi:hypothetical protein
LLPAILAICLTGACWSDPEWPPVQQVCGTAVAPPAAIAQNRWTAVLTTARSGFPDYDYIVVWLCMHGRCQPAFSFNDTQVLAAQWRPDGRLEVVHTSAKGRVHRLGKRRHVTNPPIIARRLRYGADALPERLTKGGYGQPLTNDSRPGAGTPTLNCEPWLDFSR